MHLSTRLVLSFFLFFFSAYRLQGQVTAGFTASPLSGCAPLVVAFANSSVPVSGTTYVWNMGNGSGPITLTNPGASYLAAGTYTVTLTATNGSSSSTYSRVITVYPAPTVSFSVNDTAVCPGEPVTFTSTSVAGIAGPVTYLWSSGDGYTSTSAVYTHAYALPGNFNVTLNLTNSAGCASLLTKPAYVHVFTPPSPSFTASPRRICNHSGTVAFTSTPTGTGPFTYRWTFGDGSPPSTLATPSHFYAFPGAFGVKQVVTDSHGCMDSILMTDYIHVSTLTATFSGPDSACIYSPVTFFNTSTPHISRQWIYGDLHTDTTFNGNHVYTMRGSYTVTLIVNDSFCSDAFSRPFVVPSPILTFTITPARPCPAPVNATLIGTVPPGSGVVWNFGDSTTGSGASTSHTFTKNEIDTVTMVVTSSLGCKDTVSKLYKIYNLRIDLINSGHAGGCIPLTVDLAGSALTDVPPPPPGGIPDPYPYQVYFKWDFGDGSPNFYDSSVDNVSHPTHVYTAIGIYPVTIYVLTENGCTVVKRDTVYAGVHPVSTFTATPRHVCYNRNEIKFTRTLLSPVQPGVYWYYWLFGDGVYGYPYLDTAQATVRDVLYHFHLPGLFSDTLISYHNGCPDTFIRKDYILIDSPMSRARARVLCSPLRTAAFADSSIGADTHLWQFGDGTTSTVLHPTHTFPAATLYQNFLIVTNTLSGCKDTSIVYTDLARPVVNIWASDTTICKDQYVTMRADVLSGLTTYFKWLAPGNYSNNTTNTDNPYFIDTFHVPGLYTIKLITYDGHLCPDTLTKTNYIMVARPNVHFGITPASLCWPQSTTFIDSTTDQPGAFPVSRYWSFGDGVSVFSGSATTGHSYAAAGTYTIKEIVTDNIGCKDSVSVNRTFYHPKAFFTASNTNPCRNAGVTFTNTSTSGATYLWAFGDGVTSTALNPVHAYADTGHFTVRLIATESHGCKDTATYVGYIVVSGPHAAFTMDDSVAVCPPLTVHFTNTSTGGATNYWNLGNGNISVASNPTNLYTVPGYDTVYLVVTDTHGCKDTTVRHVKVYGYAGSFSYSTDSGCTSLAVLFNADLSSISLASSITWDFSDGVVSTPSLADTITHVYLVPGAYIPKLILRDHFGCVDSSMGKDTIKVNGVKAGFIADPDTVCIGTPMSLVDTSLSFWSVITTWNWTHNGTTSSLDTASVTYTASGTYPVSLQVTDGWGCTAFIAKNVYVYELPPIKVSPDSVICERGTVVLTDSTAGGIWISADTTIATVSSSGIATGVAAGTTVITYATTPTCFTTAPVTINPVPDPGTITGDDGICVGSTLLLTDTVAGGVWSVSNGNASITAGGLLKGLMPGFDTVSYTVIKLNCEAVATKVITIYPLPDPGEIIGNDTVCKGATIQLTDTVVGGIWSTSNTTVAAIDTDGTVHGVSLGAVTITYTVPTDTNGCTNFITFHVTVVAADFALAGNITPVKCYGGNDGSIAVTVNGGVPPFQFIWPDSSTAPSYTSLAAGVYAVTVFEPTNGCTLVDSFRVTMPDSIRIDADIVTDVCARPNGSITLKPTGGTAPYQYLWSNNAVGNAIGGLASGNYSCTVTDANGCIATIAIKMADSTCPDIIIFNAISANGDGINDTWVIEGLSHYPANTVQVFDKWGDIIYEQKNYQNDWGGQTAKGAVPDGTYYYLVKLNAEVASGRDTFTGYLMIKR